MVAKKKAVLFGGYQPEDNAKPVNPPQGGSGTLPPPPVEPPVPARKAALKEAMKILDGIAADGPPQARAYVARAKNALLPIVEAL